MQNRRSGVTGTIRKLLLSMGVKEDVLNAMMDKDLEFMYGGFHYDA